MNFGKVSVCIATYNGEKFIKEQLNSILCQIRENDEIIISDDGSTDNTIKIIETFNDNRIKLFSNNVFHSPIFNFENALKHSSGDIIFLSDQDDIWLPNRVETILSFFDKYDLVINDAYVVDENGKIIEESLFKITKAKKGFIKNFIKNSYVGCCIAFKREIKDIALPFPKEIPMHDWWIGLIAELYGKVFFLNKPLVYYRRHSSNFSNTTNRSKYNFFDKIKMRKVLIKEIICRITR